MFTALLLGTIGVCTADAAGLLHAPHDPVYSIASVQLPDGRVVAVTVGAEGAVLFTTDRGLSWSMLAGEGLELETPWEVTYHPGLAAAGGSGLFLIGTQRGVWTWDPVADVVGTLHTGLAASDLHVLDLESPLAGSDGPAVALSATGSVYLLWPQAMVWSLATTLPDGVFGRRGGVALTPHYDSQSAALGAHDLFACGSGRLYVSRDNGTTWSPHAQFPNVADAMTDWSIATVALSEDYANDGLVMLGRVRFDNGAGSDRGEIWRSGNGGLTFQRVRTMTSGVISLLGTPTGPGGGRTWLAATRSYPNVGAHFGTGIECSRDGGLSWSDYGNDQDFLMEDNPGKQSGNVAQNYEQQLCVLADYGARGEVWYGRQEGLFASVDEGEHWVQRQVRLEREFRDVETAVTSAGERAVFGAGYGVGTVLHVPALGVVNELPDAPPMVYQRRLSISPRFAFDGNLIVAGNVTLWAWQDPNVAPANPKNAQRWWQPDNRDPVSGEKLTGFPRVVSYSPNFDGRGLPGTDRTYFWCGWDFGPYRSEDNGATAEPLHAKSGGGTVGEMTCFAIAPTYDAAGTRTDAYCADAAGRLYRLVNEEWLEIADLGPLVEDLIVAPTWSRPGNPALFAALAGPPYVALVLDHPGNVQVYPYPDGLPAVVANGLAARPDFAANPILYLSTFGSGVWKMDFGAASPSWSQVGLDFPRLWARDVALSPDFANDLAVFAATQRGLWFCSDQPGSFWQPLTLAGSRDESDESFQFFQPAHPANPHPDHAWPWQQVMRWALPFPIVVFGDAIRYTAYDGSYAVTEARCAALEVLTVGGPGCGTLLLEAHDRDTGALINSRTVDLRLLAGTQKEERVRLDLGSRKTVRVTATAVLDPGEVLVLDGVRFED